MSGIRLFFRCSANSQAVVPGSPVDITLFRSSVPDHDRLHLGNVPNYQRKFRLWPHPFKPDLFEIILDLPVEELCSSFEINCCRGKKVREFSVPFEIIQSHGVVRALASDFVPEEAWDEYPAGAIKSADPQADTVVTLIGDIDSGVAEVSKHLQRRGIDAKFGVVPKEGDAVLFCVSCAEGITVANSEAVLTCSGVRIRPVGLLLTHYALVDDESLRDLLTVEEQELLSRILPEDVVTGLPLLIDGDPYLPERIRPLTEQTMAVVCREPNSSSG